MSREVAALLLAPAAAKQSSFGTGPRLARVAALVIMLSGACGLALTAPAEPVRVQSVAITVSSEPSFDAGRLIQAGFESAGAQTLVRLSPQLEAYAMEQAELEAAAIAQADAERMAQVLMADWSLSEDYAQQVTQALIDAAERFELDPLLLMAVAAVESSFRHNVGNPGGGADPFKPYGIMQVAGQWHREKFPGGRVRATSLEENIQIGAQVLNEYLEWEKGDERRALLRYNGSLGLHNRYYVKVSQYREQFRSAIEQAGEG